MKSHIQPKIRPPHPDYVIYIDGAAYPNPSGAIGMGVIIRDGKGNLITELWDYEDVHEDHSNNVAEYMALLMALEYIDLPQTNKKTVAIVHSDSKLLVKQMGGFWGIKEGRYLEVAKRCEKLVSKFALIWFQWISREYNTEADLLSKKGFNEPVNR